MKKYHQVSQQQNYRETSERPSIPTECEESKLGQTLQIEVHTKNEIIITAQQLLELTRLFKDGNEQKPGWLRRRFLLNQRRRKLLNHLLFEAGCDATVCGTLSANDDWFYALHTVWHLINERPLCGE